MIESERFRAALEEIARLPANYEAGDEAGKIARAALLEAELTSEENPDAIQVLISKLKRTSMTTTEKLLQWKPQQCSFDELLELRGAARSLRAEYHAHQLEHPYWLPKAESELDNEINSRAQTERLRLLCELKKERVGLDQQIATFEATLHQ